ncbi:MAG: DUF4364 family protein [Clostridia bacterium]|nr:DUF4364 family protein [Clostridia bacterium]
MKLAEDNSTLAENKLLVLYILNKIGKPISQKALLELIVSITELNYFYFQQFLLDLIENNYVIEYEKDGEQLYKITIEGKRAIELTADMIPGILTLKVDNNLKENLEEIEDKFSVSADYTPTDENHFIVKCKIVENNNTMFELQTFAGSKEQAKIIVDNWNNNAEKIYPEILNLLTK